MTKAINAANYIFWLEDLQPSIRATQENQDIGPGDFKSLYLENLQFSYPMRPDARVLRGIELHVCQPKLSPFCMMLSLPTLWNYCVFLLALGTNNLHRSKRDNSSPLSVHLAVERVP